MSEGTLGRGGLGTENGGVARVDMQRASPADDGMTGETEVTLQACRRHSQSCAEYATVSMPVRGVAEEQCRCSAASTGPSPAESPRDWGRESGVCGQSQGCVSARRAS